MIKEKKIISNSSCPPEIKSNNLRNIYIHNVIVTRYSANFDVTFIFNYPFKNNFECINDIFVENLNIYFLNEIKKRKLSIKSEINYLKEVKKSVFQIYQSEIILDKTNLDLRIIKAELLHKFYDEQIKFFVDPNSVQINFKIDNNVNNLFFPILFLFVALQMAFFYFKKKNLNLLKYFFK